MARHDAVFAALLTPLITVCGIMLVLTGCVTSDLAEADFDDGKAVLVLYPMASSEASTRCMIAVLDGQDVRKRQSWRLTNEYLIPAGRHSYGFVCEESAGSIASGGYRFALMIETIADVRYGLLQQQRHNNTACIVVQELDKETGLVIAEHCLQ